MTKDPYRFQCRVEIGKHNADHDVYITYNNSQWSGLTCRTLEDLRKVHDEIGTYLLRHQDEH